MLIKRFDKILETCRAQWIAASSAACGANQCKQFIKDDKMIQLRKAFL